MDFWWLIGVSRSSGDVQPRAAPKNGLILAADGQLLNLSLRSNLLIPCSSRNANSNIVGHLQFEHVWRNCPMLSRVSPSQPPTCALAECSCTIQPLKPPKLRLQTLMLDGPGALQNAHHQWRCRRIHRVIPYPFSDRASVEPTAGPLTNKTCPKRVLNVSTN